MSPTKTNRTNGAVATIGARAKGAAAQAIPAGKLAGMTAVQGVRQGVQGARDWTVPRIQGAVEGTKGWTVPRVQIVVLGAREWAAPRLEQVADVIDLTVAPTVSSALRSTASQVRPPVMQKRGFRRLLDWRWLVGIGAAAAGAGAGTAVAMRRRYASATAEAKDASESPEAGGTADTGMGSDVNGRVTTPGS